MLGAYQAFVESQLEEIRERGFVEAGARARLRTAPRRGTAGRR